ncbi:MAG TPA: 5-oxoprolinase subunit PxpB [Gaiellaceae bacterium]|nr:5-oxoprolinase subunit PxpB [Gaiellaceae bacterium]
MSSVGVRPCGDRALMLELADNAAAVRVAARLREERPDLVDVVPGHRSVLVTWAGARAPTGLDELAGEAVADTRVPEGREVELAVTYDGPDLDEVAGLTGLSPEEVVARHRAAEYVAGFLGFAPGFAYLFGLDERLVVPRRSEPRTRVPGGTVAIAGPYSGVYPRESPGGWRLVGRTDAVLFDAGRDRPALLVAGDRVRFR